MDLTHTEPRTPESPWKRVCRNFALCSLLVVIVAILVALPLALLSG